MMMIRKRLLPVWFAICLLAVCAQMPQLSHADSKTYEGSGWATPEEAVLCYLEGLKEQDLDKIISAYAVETYTDRFDFQAYLERMRSFNAFLTPRMPNTGGLLRDMSIIARKNQIASSLYYQILTICMPGRDFSMAIHLAREDEGESVTAFIEEFEGAFGAVDFGTLQFICFSPPEQFSDLYASEENQEKLKVQSVYYGSDEVRSACALFLVDRSICILMCDVVRYGDLWYMLRTSGNIGSLMGPMRGLDASGGIILIPLDEAKITIPDNAGEVDISVQDIWDDLMDAFFRAP